MHFLETVVVVLFKLFACDGAWKLRDALAVGRSRIARVVLVHVHMQARAHTDRHTRSERHTNTFELSSSAMHSGYSKTTTTREAKFRRWGPFGV